MPFLHTAAGRAAAAQGADRAADRRLLPLLPDLDGARDPDAAVCRAAAGRTARARGRRDRRRARREARRAALAVLIIRPYRPSDRERVREIAFATGYMGEPPDFYWRDAESFAEVWTAWYTDHEPESSFVAEQDHEVVGYLVGCLDSALSPSPRSAVTAQLLRRALLLRPGTAGFFWRGMAGRLQSATLPRGGR